MRHAVPLLCSLATLSGCASDTYALGARIRSAENRAEICRGEVSNRLYGGRQVQLAGPPTYLTRPGLRAVTINVVPSPGAPPDGWHCLFGAQGQMLSIAPGDAQARSDFLY
jgi:hypothetical protein